MDLWNRARVFAEEAAKKSQEISIEAAKKSQELFLTKGIGVAKEFSHDFVSEASKKAELIKIEALKRADQIKSLASDIEIPNPIAKIVGEEEKGKTKKKGEEEVKKDVEEELEKFGVTENLREFVKGITISTFRDFPMEDEPEIADVPTVSNIRQDLNEWQARHATLVLSAVKEISKFRYELCPRYMKERKFWQIYFILVDNHVIPYQKRYFEAKVNLVQQEKDVKAKEPKMDASSSTAERNDVKLQTKTSTSASAEHDLDVFLLGDLGSSDGELDTGGDDFDDDFDKIDDKALESEDDTEKTLAA